MRHADETGWRTDGRSGYAWLFASATASLFLFRATGSAQVPKEVLGEQVLGGVLVVDRYNAYNRAPCALQYCYAHLLRDVEDLAKEFPAQAEVTAFTSTLIPVLAEAMHLRGRPLADAEYYDQARPLQQQARGSGCAARRLAARFQLKRMVPPNIHAKPKCTAAATHPCPQVHASPQD